MLNKEGKGGGGGRERKKEEETVEGGRGKRRSTHVEEKVVVGDLQNILGDKAIKARTTRKHLAGGRLPQNFLLVLWRLMSTHHQ